MNNPLFKDLSGQRFSRWTALRRVDNDAQGNARFLCRCDCGTERIVLAKSLRSGGSHSCGCQCLERVKSAANKHGLHKHKLYAVWNSIKHRCLKPYSSVYQSYGGRGIGICDEWLDFEAFYDWAIANGYQEGLQIDRIDNDGNYEPSNCRWVTHKENCNNRKRKNQEHTKEKQNVT